MPVIRRAIKFDEPSLKNMWRLCFGDPDKAIDFIFDRLLMPENMMVMAGEDGGLAAMLSIQELELLAAEKSCKAAYVFAVATLPEHQGKGCSTALLNDMHLLLADEGYACSVLVPAEKSLFDFYAKRGYETAFHLNRAEARGNALKADKGFELTPLSVERFIALRDSYFGGSTPFARWDKDYLRFIGEAGRFWGGDAGGDVFGFSIDGQAGYVVCYRSGGTLFIKELAAPENSLERVLGGLHSRFNAEEYVLYLRENVQTPYTNNILPFAMVKWYDNDMKLKMQGAGGLEPPYIAHVLDD